MAAAAPAADFKWPIWLLTDPIRMGPRAPLRCVPITSVSASTSTLSPTTVEVPWHSMRSTSTGSTRVGIGTAEGTDLALNVGCRNALSFAVRGGTNTANNGVDFVAIGLGIGQPF